jgi:K+-transporting ATPase ATPase C chain
MWRHLKTATILYLTLSVVTGVLYPLAVTAIAQVALPARANGSLIVRDGRTLGSTLIGQSFNGAGYFWGRPSATGPMPYNAAASSGANLGPTNPALEQAVRERIAALRAADPGNLAMSAPRPPPSRWRAWRGRGGWTPRGCAPWWPSIRRVGPSGSWASGG